MKRIKDVLDFFISLVSAWKIILPLFLLVLSAIIAMVKFSNRVVAFSLPIWAISIISVLALYPIGKFIEYGLKRKHTPPFKLFGLLWKTPLLPFQYPVPLCPHNDCGLEVICKQIPPSTVTLVTGLSDFNKANFEYRYVYECPVHGKISGVPNEAIRFLQHKAKIAAKKR